MYAARIREIPYKRSAIEGACVDIVIFLMDLLLIFLNAYCSLGYRRLESVLFSVSTIVQILVRLPR